jgi:hemerythrin-like domain-containing protein
MRTRHDVAGSTSTQTALGTWPARSPARRSEGRPIGRRSVTRSDTQENPMDAIALLEADHQKVKRLLAELESTTERGVKTRTELFATIKGELTLHEIVEEEIFYPELKAHPKAQDIVLEGYEEHHVVDLLMGELEALDVSDETWGAKALVMKENIEHHIEEEEGEMFKQARQVFDAVELDDLGARMETRKAAAGRELNIPVTAPR